MISSIIQSYAYMNDVRVRVMRKIDDLDLGLIKLSNCREGIVINVPEVLAQKLVKENIVELFDEDFVKVNDLDKQIWLERRSQFELRQLPKDFYSKVRLSITQYLAKGNDKEAKQLIQYFRELLHWRLRKILYVVGINVSIADSREVLEKLTIEEELLVKIISNLVKDWINVVLGI